MILGRWSSSASGLARSSSGTFVLIVTGAGLSFLMSVMLARILGSTGFGAYAYAMAWINFMAAPATLGLDWLLVREISTYQARSQAALLHGLGRRADQAVVASSLILSVLAALFWIFQSRVDPQLTRAVWPGLILLLVTVLLNLRRATLEGLHRVVAGQIPDRLITPLGVMILIGVAHWVFQAPIAPEAAVGARVAAVVVGLVFATWMVRRNVPQRAPGEASAYRDREWWTNALPFMLIGTIHVIYAETDVLMLGAFRGAESSGIYRAAAYVASLIGFPGIAVNKPAAPVIARLLALGERDELQRLVSKSGALIALLSLPIGLVLIGTKGWPFLNLFGEEFSRGAMPLMILSSGLVLNALICPVDTVLGMGGYGRENARAVVIGALANVVLNACLIPRWGMNGAALATALSITLRKLLMAFWIQRRLGISSSLFAWNRGRP